MIATKNIHNMVTDSNLTEKFLSVFFYKFFKLLCIKFAVQKI